MMKYPIVTLAFSILWLTSCQAFNSIQGWNIRQSTHGGSSSALKMIFNFGGGAPAKIPASASDRDNRAIASIQRALASPKNPSFPLVECEFPPLELLNKLGDGSRRSAQDVDKANLSFAKKLVNAISMPIIGSEVCLLVSSAASAGFYEKAKSLVGANKCRFLREGIPQDLASNVVYILLAPSTRTDYQFAKTCVQKRKPNKVIIVNGFAKDRDSVAGEATIAYYFKPLTYNSQIAGYLIREYPGPWTTLDATTKEVLQKCEDCKILVDDTNTPDLRESGRLVQKSVDNRAIQSRRR